ncbi:MAG: DUF2911 domain-containing protein [Gemmatimonadota bacterium]
MKCSLALITATVCVGSTATAQTAAFVTKLGRDTIAFERFTRTGNRLEGTAVQTVPRTRIVDYVVTLGADGQVSRLEVRARPAVPGPGGQPPVDAIADFGASGVTAVVKRGATTDTTKIAAGAGPILPLYTNTWGVMELTTQAAAKAGSDSLAVSWYAPGQPRLFPSSVVRRGTDSVAVDFFGSPIMIRTDKAGRILGVNGSRTTQKVLAERLSDLDVAKLTESFAARERTGQVAGMLSPRDTVRAAVAGADLLVDYGRPSKRGRQIWGAVVPYDEVWRTGANAATQLVTSKDLELGGVVIPAGKYTLWTLPTTHGTKLIINKQTGQWGTDYHADQDLARVDVDVERIDAAPVERFTISVAPDQSGGRLQLSWDATRLVVPFRVK